MTKNDNILSNIMSTQYDLYELYLIARELLDKSDKINVDNDDVCSDTDTDTNDYIDELDIETNSRYTIDDYRA